MRDSTNTTRRARILLALVGAGVLTLGACGDSTTPPEENAPIAFLVGEWMAVRMVVTSKADPSVAPDLMARGVSFFVDVQPSGQYTAILTALGIPATEFGQVSVRGNHIFFHREQPGPPQTDSASYRMAADTLFLVGDTEFDFDLNGQAEPGILTTGLLKRP